MFSFNIPALQRRSFRYQVMTRRWIETPDLLRMAIHTREAAILINRDQLFAQVLTQAIFVMTLSTRCDLNIRLQPAERCGFRDVDMARRALGDVLLLLAATIVYELR
jgi:hypothetical protein